MPIRRIESGVAPSKTKFRVEAFTHTIGVGPATAVFQTLTPPKGKIWKIQAMYLNADIPAGGAAGTHDFMVYTNALLTYLIGKSTFAAAVKWNVGIWESANDAKQPTTEGAALAMISNIIISNTYPLSIVYHNDTDVNQAGNIVFRFDIVESSEI